MANEGFRTTTGNPAAPPYRYGPYRFSEIMTFDQDVTVTGTLTVNGGFSFGDAGADNFTINDNGTLRFEGVAGTLDGATLNCDSSGDFLFAVTAGKLTINTSDNSILMTGETLTVGTLTDGTLSITGGDITSGGSFTATTVNATNYEANDSTACFTIADSTGVATMSTKGIFSSGVTINDDSEFAADKDLTFGTTGRVNFFDTDMFMRASADGNLETVSDTLYTITSPTVTIASATLINLDGDTTLTGVLVLDDTDTTGINLSGTYTTGIDLGDNCTTGLDIGNATTGISINGAYTTSGIYISGTFASGGALNVGTFAAPITMYNTSDIPTVMISGEVLADQGSGVTQGLWVRAKISKEQTACSVIGIEAQCRVNGAVSAAATLGAGQFTGLWAYWEQSGTTALNTGALASATSCTVEGAATLTIDSGAILAGAVVDSSVDGSATNNGTFDGIYIKKGAGALDFVSGIEMTDCISDEVFKFADDGTICNDGNTQAITNLTTAGYLTVKVGEATRYVWLGSNAPTA